MKIAFAIHPQRALSIWTNPNFDKNNLIISLIREPFLQLIKDTKADKAMAQITNTSPKKDKIKTKFLVN